MKHPAKGFLLVYATAGIALGMWAQPYALDNSFAADFDGNATALALDSSGKVYVAGENRDGTGSLARLNADGSLDESFSPTRSLAKIAYGLVYRNDKLYSLSGDGVRRYSTDGALELYVPSGSPTSFAVDSIGRIIITRATDYLVQERVRRYNPDGSMDRGFNVVVGCCYWEGVWACALQTVLGEEKILFGGTFSRVGSNQCYNIARLNDDGTVDSTFTGWSGNRTVTINVASNGSILTGSYGLVHSMLPDGSADPAFPGYARDSSSFRFQAVARHPDGKVVVMGIHLNYREAFVVRLNADASLDSQFRVLIDGLPPSHSLAIEGNGNILIGRGFTNVNCIPRSGIARLVPSEVSDPLPCLPEPPKPEPELIIMRIRHAKMVCSWPANYPEYTLQATRRLRPNHPERERWRTVTNAPFCSETECVVTNRIARWGKYYRLVKIP